MNNHKQFDYELITPEEYKEIYRCVHFNQIRVQNIVDNCEDVTVKKVWQEQTNIVHMERNRILEKLRIQSEIK